MKRRLRKDKYQLDDYDFALHTIQDPIHGAILFGRIEKAIIDHSLFQRLHGLRQNSLLYLIFPSANHTRFDHSLGVMHLAGEFFDAILRNQRKICDATSKSRAYHDPYRVDDAEMNVTMDLLGGDQYFKLILRLAALCHDIGHGPLSHLFDRFFPTVTEFKQFKKSKTYGPLTNCLNGSEKIRDPVRHEVLSCAIASRIIHESSPVLETFGLDENDVISDVCSVIDDRISPSSQLLRPPYKVHKLFHDIVASDIDVDRMDYLVRDSHMCGVNYGLYDPDRILKSMCVYARKDNRELRAGIRSSGLGALEDLLLSRYQMYAQIYGHKTNRACNAMLDRIQERLKKAGWSWYRGCRTLDELLGTFEKLDDRAFINILLTEDVDKGAGKVREIAEKLFLNRRLVKRVFEERVALRGKLSKERRQAETRMRDHQDRLKDSNIWAAPDVFENKGPKINTGNSPLKLLKKDPREGHYLVHEIRGLSTVVQFLPERELTFRIYCREHNVKKAKLLLPL